MTLIETALAAIVAGVLVVAALNATGVHAATRRSMGDRAMARGLVRTLCSEIALRAYADPTSGAASLGIDPDDPPGSGRSAWDDVDDYEGLDELDPADAFGQALLAEPGWRWRARVWYVDPGDPEIAVQSDQGAKRIEVRVERAGRLLASAVMFRTRGRDAVIP